MEVCQDSLSWHSTGEVYACSELLQADDDNDDEQPQNVYLLSYINSYCQQVINYNIIINNFPVSPTQHIGWLELISIKSADVLVFYIVQ